MKAHPKNSRGKQKMNCHYTSGLPYIRDDEKSIFTLGHRTPFGKFTFWLCPHYYTFCFLWFTNCVLLYDKESNTRMLVTFGICFKLLFDTRYLVFCNLSPPRMFLPLDLLSEYRIQHCAIGPLYVTSSYSSWIFCRGFQACACGVWCRGLTTCLLHVGPPFWNRFLNNS